MPLTIAEFDNHSLWPALDSLDSSIQDLGELANEDGSEYWEMIPFVVADLRALREVPSWRFADSTILDNIQAQVNALASYVNAAREAEDTSAASTQLRPQLIQGIDQINAYLNSAPRPVTGPRDGKGLVVATRQVHEMYESRAADLKKRLEALDKLIEERQQQLSKVEARASTTAL